MSLMIRSLPFLLSAAVVTLYLAVAGVTIGLVLGLVAALVRVAKMPVLDPLARLYVSVIRGTPLLVQVYVVYYGLPQFGIRLDPITSGIAALSINIGAYLSESFRAALESVDRGQMDAALSIGMTYWQAMRRIIIPQSFRTALPTIGNSFIGLLKDTSLVSVITVQELLRATTLIIARTFQPLPLLLEAAVIYWVMSSGFSYIQQRVEKVASRHVRR